MAFQTLIKPSVCPPDGFRYVDPISGWVDHAWDYPTWIAQAEAHLYANNRPRPSTLEQDMMEQLCRTLPPGWCSYEGSPYVSVSLNWDDVKTGVDAFLRLIKGGFKTVGDKEAERRAAVCARCYLNVNVQGCSACKAAVSLITGRYKTKQDAALKTCAVCRCFLRAKVHFPLSILDKNNPGAQAYYPEFCWLKKGGENYRG